MIKNATGKILRTVSEHYPEKVYPKFDFFVEYMNSDDTILKWLAIDTIANMAAVDEKNKIDKLLKNYYKLLSDESMITAAHAVDGLGKIAVVKPKYQNEITKELFRIKSIKRNPECRNIILGRVIIAYGGYMDGLSIKDEVIGFVKKELRNRRPATKKKAEKFLKKYDK